MVRWALKRSLRPASCCSVEVMNGGAGERRKGFSVTARTVKGWPARPAASAGGLRLAQHHGPRPGAVSAPCSAKSLPGGHGGARPPPTRVAPKPAGAVGRRVEGAVDVPPGGRAEAHAGPLALDDHAGGHALDPAGRQPRHDLLPQHGRHLVAVEAVEDAAGLLGVDQAAVEVAPLLDGALRWPAGVISWKTMRLTGTVGDEHLGAGARRSTRPRGPRPWPGRPRSASFSSCLSLATTDFFSRRHHVERLEAVVDVDARGGPTPRPCRRRGPRRPAGAGPGCGRSTTRRRSPARAGRRWSGPWPATRR